MKNPGTSLSQQWTVNSGQGILRLPAPSAVRLASPVITRHPNREAQPRVMSN